MNTYAKVTKPFPGRRDGGFEVEDFSIDAIIEGDLAAVAIKEGWAIAQKASDAEQPRATAKTEKKPA